MSEEYEKPEVLSFKAELSLLYTSCNDASYGAPEGPALTMCGCGDGGCPSTGATYIWAGCTCPP